jgi:hypothetical protein
MAKFDEFRSGLEIQSDYLEDNKFAVRFANRNRFLARPGSEKTSRGFSAVTLLLEDEASRVPDVLYKSIRPMLAVSHGRHILMSTPFGKRGHFFEIWNKNRPSWERYEVTADQCPRIEKSFLKEEREELGDLFFMQEYYCTFIDEENQLFSYDLVKGALSSEVAPLVF